MCQDYKSCLKTSYVIYIVNYLKKERNYCRFSQRRSKKIRKKKNKLILKTQQRFKSERHNVFTKVINKITSGSTDKRIQLIDSIETYTHGMNKDLKCKKDKIKHINIIKQSKNV